MSLFNFGKKKESKNPSCACKSNSASLNLDQSTLNRIKENNEKNITIKVLGTGCKSCHSLLDNTKSAVQEMGINAQVEYVNKMENIAKYGVMSVPALVINEEVISYGKVLKIDEIKDVINEIFN